ncbi:MAG: ABC transporter permease [Chloroflexi bacterium]|nr:ABC transporter permease [Chloroflexota bacterium]
MDRVFRGHAILLYVFLYVPIALVVVFSFNAGERTGELRGLSLRWYEKALSDAFALGALGNSVIVGLWTALIATTLGTVAALAINRAARPIRVAFEAVTYVAIIIPGIVIAIATLIFYVNFFAWVNPWLSYAWESLGLGAAPVLQSGLHTIIGAHVVFTSAIVFVLVRARLSGMDLALVEASADLYATPWRTLRQVTLPQLRPAILAGALLSFTFSFDDYIIASFVQGPGQPTLPLFVFGSIRRGITPQINAIASLILLVTLTALVVVYLVFRSQAKQSARVPDDSPVVPAPEKP